MRIKNGNLLVYPNILFLLGLFFYFDKGLMPGNDVHWYLDLSYLVHQGGKFLVDYIDYRIPVFSWFFSWLYGFDFGDFINRYIITLVVYFLYISLIYRLSFSLTHSRAKSIFVGLITFISISARDFDAGRDILQPLFHHVLELGSLMLLVKTFYAYRHQNRLGKSIAAGFGLAGVLAGLAFVGRQIQLFPFVLIISISFYLFRRAKDQRVNIFWLNLIFWGGAAAAIGIVLLRFIAFDTESLKQVKMWLVDMPKIWLNFQRFVTRGILIGLLEFRNIRLPIFFMTYFCFGLYVFRGIVLMIKEKKAWGRCLTVWFATYKKPVFIMAILIFTYGLNVVITGIGPARYESPLFTLYAVFLAFLINELGGWFKKLHPFYKLLLVVPLFINFIKFTALEAKSYEISNKYLANPEKLECYQLAAALRMVMTEERQTVLVLGSAPAICRLAKLKPYMGCNTDIFLLGAEKLNHNKMVREIKVNLKDVKVIYKLWDYPNIKDTELQIYLDDYLKNNYKLYQNMPLFGRNAYIYVRK